jgi:hypothetical protein
MDFITGALPNVMFIAGLIAIGLGLGIEFKIVEIKGELSKIGRFAAVGIGAVLVSISIYLYTRPAHTASIPAAVAGAQQVVMQATASGTGSAPQAQVLLVDATAVPSETTTNVPPTATVVPPTATPVPPTATAERPTATAVPPTATAVPTAIPVPPTATAVPGVTVPDIRGQSSKDAQKTLTANGLQLGERRVHCETSARAKRKTSSNADKFDASRPHQGALLCPTQRY